MVFINFINWFANLFSGTSFDVNFDGSVFSVISQIWHLLNYILPMDVFFVILGIMGIINAIKLTVSIWRFIISVVPFV